MYNHIHGEQNIITADAAEIISHQHKTNWFSYSAEPGAAFDPDLYLLPMTLIYIFVSPWGPGTL